MYIYELSEWPNFYWKSEKIAEPLAAVRHQQGRLIGRMEALGFPLQEEAVFRTLTQEILMTSEIEGQIFDPEQVRSSLARRLGMDRAGLKPADRDVEGTVDMMLDATKQYDSPLTAERLFSWHAALFPSGHSGITKIKTANWRDDSTGPMQVISGPVGREKIHYEAPPAEHLAKEMKAFLNWFEGGSQFDPVLKAAVAHLWFVTIHPFDDGNGRIARAIADLALARSEKTAQRFYSMSAQIRLERNAYYDILELTQKGKLDITAWLEWFLACLGRAMDGAQTTLSAVMRKSQFWESTAKFTINERQKQILNRLIDGFEGKLTTSKWAKLAKCSQDTALRDINDLVQNGVLIKDASGGRSTSYSLTE